MTAPVGIAHPACVLFDMDGTLVQSREAAWQVFAPINQQFALGIDSAEDFYEIFTQNLLEGLTRHLGDAELAELVIQEFFQRLKDHYRPQFIPGMAQVIRSLAATTTLAIVTANVMEVVRKILVDHGVATCFAHVFSGDVEPSKARVIEHLKSDAAYTLARHCSPYYDEADETLPADSDHLIMVTDTVGDVRAARSEGIRSIGVAWGMHSQDRLLEAGAEDVALWPQELLSLLSDNSTLVAADQTCQISCAVQSDQDSLATREGGDEGAESARSNTPLLGRVRAGHNLRRARTSSLAANGTARPAHAPVPGDNDPQLATAIRRIVFANPW